ncbi:MAG: hypothetical protein J5608_03275 [Alphaproteobacteria bacterium]|nr:hypothetical protein [Alphaproteobacteria bacterium]
MLENIKIYSSDPTWRKILAELGATVTDAPNILDVNFDKIAPREPVSPMELKALILAAMDTTKILHNIFGNKVPQLSDIQTNIIVLLVRSGGMTGNELKDALGYMPDVATHTITTAIYTLRKLCGHDFIILDGGVYKIGSV